MNPRRPAAWLGVGGLALIVLAMFFDVLFAPGTRVLGAERTDLAHYFLPSRDFGFGELAKGNLALWNPHLFAGVPYFGGMQSALLYPPNFLFLFLPLPLATNWSIACNIFLLGGFMYLWGLRRALHPLAALVSAVLLMFCGPHFLHVHGGHLTLLAAMAWTPLLFMAIDDWIERRRPSAGLLGMLAVGMQVLAGSPQFAYLAAVAAGGYALLRLFEPAARGWAIVAGLLAIYAGGALLAAVQLLPGIQATAETIRGRPLPIAFAASFNFPPENLVTLLAPGFLGDLTTHVSYWGRWYLWEACAFIGVAGLALAVHGIATARFAGRGALLAVAAASVLVALGDSTPLFRALFEWFPLFDRFRGVAKFFFPAALVLALCAGYGMDRILSRPGVPKRWPWGLAAAALFLCIAALVASQADWSALARTMLASGQTFGDAGRYTDPGFLKQSQDFAVRGLLVAALTVAVVAALAGWAGKRRGAALLLAALAMIEVFAFARLHRPTFDSARLAIPQLRDFLAQNPGGQRILSLPFSNRALSMRAFEAWGYDPFVTRRYAEFIAWSEGLDPAAATEYMTFRSFHPLLSMLRVKHLVTVDDGRLAIIPGAVTPLRRLELIGAYRVEDTPAKVLRALGDPAFDPRTQVILEQQPQPAPAGGATEGRAAIVREGTDFIDIVAELARPGILLVTDAWASGWSATALDGSGRTYALMPANYALRAIALDRGRHLLRLEYTSAWLRIGAILSALAWVAWLLAALNALRGKRA